MEHLPFALLALLPLGLFGLLERGRHRQTAGFAFLAALAPLIAKGIGSLISHKQAGSKEKQAEEQKRLEAEQADKLARQEWDTQQNSPAAQAARFKSKFAYGKLAGAMGGLDKVPQSLSDYYKSGYATPEYGGTSSYVPTAKKGGGVWDFLGEAAKAASYLNPADFKSGPKPPAATGFGGSTGGFTVPQIDTKLQNPLSGLLGRLKG